MVEYYNISAFTQSGNMMEMASASNTMLGGYYFGWFVLFAVFLVVFIALKNRGNTTSASFTASTWLCMFISWMLRAMTLIDNYTFWAMILLTATSSLILFLSGDQF